MTDRQPLPAAIAFAGPRRLAAGGLAEVARAVKGAVDAGERGPVLVFDGATSQPVELDLRGTVDEVLARLPKPPAAESATEVPNDAPRGPGRPRLGVVAREVTLLPRHWAWLNEQPGGASVALRKLVDEARRANETADRVRRAREATYRFMSAMAGDAPDFEEATRALFAGDGPRFDELTERWPADVAEHARALASATFEW